MDIATLLRSAREAVDEAEIPEDLGPIAFEKAIEILSGERRRPTAQDISATPPTGAEHERTGSDTPLGRLAQRLGLDLELVDEVFHVEDGKVVPSITPSQLPTVRSTATTQLALLVAAGRQGAGVEETTPQNEIREIVNDFNRLDSDNFARTLGAMTDTFAFRGSPRNRQLKVKRSGYEKATQLVKELTGGEV